MFILRPEVLREGPSMSRLHILCLFGVPLALLAAGAVRLSAEPASPEPQPMRGALVQTMQ